MDTKEKHKTIINAALKIFSEKGYANTRMADIAEEAGISYGSLYHYFESKDVLFNTFIEDWWITFFKEWEAIKESDMPIREKLEQYMRFFFNAYSNNPHQVEIYIKEVSRGFVYHSSSRGRKNFLKVFSLCEELFSKCQERGELRNDISAHHLTRIFLGSIDAFISTLVFGKERIAPFQEDKIIKSVLGVFLHGATIWY